MKNNKEEKEKDIELFMMAQFIDVIEVLDKYEKIEEIKDDIKNILMYIYHIKLD